jgi:ribosomal protein S18 acetylase RimI-like enzyme
MKIVYQGKTKTGKEIIVRYLELDDLEDILSYINELSDERTFITYQGEHETLESEKRFIEKRLQEIKNKKAIHFVATINNRIVATNAINLSDKVRSHVGIFGITVAKNFRGEGIGKLLMEFILKEAEEEIPQLKIVALEVYSTNDIAKKMYEKFGFLEYGRLPKGIFRGGNFEDEILMYKNIK